MYFRLSEHTFRSATLLINVQGSRFYVNCILPLSCALVNNRFFGNLGKKKDYAKLSSYENNILTYCLWTVSNQFLFTGVCTKQLKSNLYCTSLIYSGINIINKQVLKSLTGLFCYKMIRLFSRLVNILILKDIFSKIKIV